MKLKGRQKLPFALLFVLHFIFYIYMKMVGACLNPAIFWKTILVLLCFRDHDINGSVWRKRKISIVPRTQTQCILQIYSGWMIMIKSSKKTYCSWNRLSDMIVFAWHPGTLKDKQKHIEDKRMLDICGFFHPFSNNGSVETGYFQDGLGSFGSLCYFPLIRMKQYYFADYSMLVLGGSSQLVSG